MGLVKLNALPLLTPHSDHQEFISQALLCMSPKQREPTENPVHICLTIDRMVVDVFLFLEHQQDSQHAPEQRGMILGDG